MSISENYKMVKCKSVVKIEHTLEQWIFKN